MPTVTHFISARYWVDYSPSEKKNQGSQSQVDVSNATQKDYFQFSQHSDNNCVLLQETYRI